MGSFNRAMVKITQGESKNKEQKSKIWKEVKIVLQVFLCDLQNVRDGVETPYSSEYKKYVIGSVYLSHPTNLQSDGRFQECVVSTEPQFIVKYCELFFDHHDPWVEATEPKERIIEQEIALEIQEMF